ncbi:PAS domain S-box protein [Methylobacterium sp. E-005]|uniref:PAS domain S-box protein n=1 Tax=Methylobacterium sp. E-005 TaxID=2836549 RepID=UPI001FB946C6|nr:PAS domain S-box protein [Methylobacterium sp. E-005]MCJ2087944.1 PAS domain S-box protein [Methylobacterium sp. E-005]
MNHVPRPARIEEDARIAALAAFDILDTPPERGFDDIVNLARRLCAAPVALVSLVDRDRQWFKARSGFPARETDLDRSVCKFVLTEPGILQIPDLTRDPRTSTNPLVTGEPHLRFYAGVPLRTPQGQVLGSLCVIDHVPRPGGLAPEQVEDLEALARQVMDQLLLRRSLSDRARAGRQGEAVAVTLAGVAAAGGDLVASFRAVLAGAMRAVTAAEAGAVEIREGDSLVSRAVSDELAPHLGLRLPIQGSLAGACYRDDVPLLVADVLNDHRVERELAEKLRMRSCLMVPVRRGGVVVGVLKLQSSRPDAFAEDDLQVLGVFAGSAASSLAEAGERVATQAAAQTEYRRRAVFDSAQDYAIILLDLDGRITDWNAGATRILGWHREEMCGETADAFFTPEDRRDGIPALEMRSALEKGTGIDERWHLRRDGERFWANGEMMVLRDEGGAAIGFVKMLRDRTEQKEAAARLRESQDRYRLAAQATNDAIRDWDLVGNHVLWNEALTDAYGHAPRDVEPTGDWWIARIHPEDRARIDASLHGVIDGDGATWTDEYRFRRADGSYAHVLDRGHVLRGEDGRACRMIGAMLDLTARKRSEDALRTSERQLGLERGLLEAIFRQAPVGISIAGAEAGMPSSLNAKAEELLGHGIGTEGDARYVSYGALHPDGRPYEPAEYPTLRALRKGETVRGEEMRYRIPGTGEVRLLEVSSGPVRDDEGTIQAAVTVLVDVGDQRRADAEARRLAALVEQSQDFIGLAAPDGSVDFVNEAGRRLIGLPDRAAARAMPIVDYFVPEERARVLAEVLPAVERDGFWEGELNFRHVVTGAAVPVLYNLFPVRGADGRRLAYGTVTRDLTEQKRARQALQASEASLRAVLDTVPVGILFAAAPSGRIIGGNRRLEDIFRHPVLPSPDVDSYGEWVAFHEDGRRVETDEYPLSRIIREGLEQAELRCEYQRGDGSRLWIEIVGVPMRDEAGTMVGAVVAVADIDVRHRAEERQELLNQELSHRMKNLLAMVQAIAASTLRGATDMDAAREVLGSRLVALGKAHDVLLGGAAESAPLAAVVREGVGVQESAGRRVAFEGPVVEIGGKAALSLALTLHELTTNAVKYGSLSVPDGAVAVTASLVGPDEEPRLRIAWIERGGPQVVPPSRKGFGSRLIERGLTAQVNASLSLDYRPEGVVCVMEALLADFQAVA